MGAGAGGGGAGAGGGSFLLAQAARVADAAAIIARRPMRFISEFHLKLMGSSFDLDLKTRRILTAFNPNATPNV